MAVRPHIKATPVQIATWFAYPENVEQLTEPQKAVILRSLEVKAKIHKAQDKIVTVNQYPVKYQLANKPAMSTMFEIVRVNKNIPYNDLRIQFLDQYPTTCKQSFQRALGKLKKENLIRVDPIN
jgi:predicted RNA-binding protein (virulence factor B family)